MSTDLEQRLRRDMERFTRDVRVPPGLALKACRHRRRQRMTARAVTAAGTVAAVTAGALTVAAVKGTSGRPGQTTQIRTDAYVITRVERALASPALSNEVSFTRTGYQPAATLGSVVPGGLDLSFGASARSPWSIGYMVRWMYHGAARISGFTSAGRPVFDWQPTTGGRAPRSVAVIYRNKTWWRAKPPAVPGPVKPVTGEATGPGPARCARTALIGGQGIGWPARIRDGLRCGVYKLDGRQRIDGIDAIKLTMLGGAGTLWVSPATYLPVRDTLDLGAVREQTDFRWLPPTRANLARLRVTIPAGFTQVPPPGG